jgi:hypothetical protein
MIWFAVALVVLVITVLVRVLVLLGDQSVERSVDDIDPLFPVGVAIAGAGVALATTLGGFMYALMIAGLILMAVGATRTRHTRR